MPEVVDWLKTLGMSEYAERFANNDIDFTILGDLTDQDLEKIGVGSLGHRRKLLRPRCARPGGAASSVPAPPWSSRQQAGRVSRTDHQDLGRRRDGRRHSQGG